MIGPRWGRDRVLALLSLGVVAGLGAVGTMAAWTDDSQATSGFSTGSVTIRLTDANQQATSFGDLAVSSLKPGQTKAAVITVRNRGSLPFIYSVAVAATDPDGKNLQGALRTVVRTDSEVVASGSSSTCSTGSSTVLERTGLAGGAVTVGGQRNPPGQPAADQVICVQVGLPDDAASSLQSASTTATLTFAATSF